MPMDAKRVLDLIAVIDGAKRLGHHAIRRQAEAELTQIDNDVAGKPALRPGDKVTASGGTPALDEAATEASAAPSERRV